MPAYIFLTKLWGDQVLYVMHSVGTESRMDGSKNGTAVFLLKFHHFHYRLEAVKWVDGRIQGVCGKHLTPPNPIFDRTK